MIWHVFEKPLVCRRSNIKVRLGYNERIDYYGHVFDSQEEDFMLHEPCTICQS